MSDDADDGLQQKLDLLLSIHSEEHGNIELAELLYATANGLVALEKRAVWNSGARRLDVRFSNAADLEASLEDLLSTRVICVPVNGDVPKLTDVDVRIVCAREHVDLRGRAVQETKAGTVVQLEPADVDVQRALVSLPAVLRSNPAEELVVDRVSVRLPKLDDPDAARVRLRGTPEQAAVVPTRTAVPPVARRPTPPPEPKPEPGPQETLDEKSEADRAAGNRLAFHFPKVEAALARAGNRNQFEFLSIHFSADTQAVAEARDELLELVKRCREDDLDGAHSEELDRLTDRVGEAWAVLGKTGERRKHRREMVPQFQIETVLEMYDKQAESAKMSRKLDVVRDCYRRIVELDPSDHEIREQLAALNVMDD